ncbi:calcium-activated potassium channel subunit alpha-1 [Thraustotheca clavata]|uniref:Calcium-activated potassium channel subunit alpha-1 n=1 Tax=Thraustotheca clavata TaxID=74557 RepID=A0A1W0A452_9STRA|nr:calcium-activated potassium channel subunit alpha-1 [Thraustotheca clavata]
MRGLAGKWLVILNYVCNGDVREKSWWPRDEFFPKRAHESFREYTQHTLEQSLAGRTLDAIMIVLSFVMVYLYMYVVWSSGGNTPSYGISLATQVIGVIFTLDYALRLYGAPLRWNYIHSYASIFDLICILPTWVEICTTQAQLDAFSKQSPENKQVIQLLRVLKSFRILRSYRLLRFTSSMVERQILVTLLTVICIIVSMSGAMQILELCPDQCVAWGCQDFLRTDGLKCVNNPICSQGQGSALYCCHCQSRPLFQWMYCMTVTISTVGYGDIAPKTRLGRLTMSFMILFTFVTLPIQVNSLVALISERSKFTSRYTGYKSHPTALLVSASQSINTTALQYFLSEFFHPDSPNWNETLLILHSHPPSAEMLKIIHAYEPRITYIVGSPLNVYDQKRAALSRAVVCYVISNHRSFAQAELLDQNSSLLTAVCRRIVAPKVPILTQVLSGSTVQHCLFSGATCVVSIEQLKLALISKSTYVVGTSTLLSNLVTTISPSYEHSPTKDPWEHAYLHGYRHEIHMLELPSQYSELLYGELIIFLFHRLHIICIAIETLEGPQFMRMDHKLTILHDGTTHVYVVANGTQAKDDVRKITQEEIHSFMAEFCKNEPTLQSKVAAKSAQDIQASKQRIETKKRQLLKIPALMKYLGTTRASQANAAAIVLAKSKRASSTGRTISPEEIKSPFDLFVEKPLPPNLRNHIILIGLPFSLFDVITTLKAANKDEAQVIVIMSQQLLTEDQFKSIFWFANTTYFFQGSALSAMDLQKASIQLARAIIVLGSARTRRKYLDENMVDSDAITTVRYIVEACQHNKVKPNMIVEIDKASNVKFLSMVVLSHRRSPRRVLRRLRHYYEDEDEGVEANDVPIPDLPHIFEPAYASGNLKKVIFDLMIRLGRVYVTGVINRVMSEWYRKPYLIHILDMLLRGHTTDISKQRQLFQAALPFALYGKTFAEAFIRLIRAGVICIGVLHAGNTCSFVYTNPPLDTVLSKDDRLFLIGEARDVIEV